MQRFATKLNWINSLAAHELGFQFNSSSRLANLLSLSFTRRSIRSLVHLASFVCATHFGSTWIFSPPTTNKHIKECFAWNEVKEITSCILKVCEQPEKEFRHALILNHSSFEKRVKALRKWSFPLFAQCLMLSDWFLSLFFLHFYACLCVIINSSLQRRKRGKKISKEKKITKILPSLYSQQSRQSSHLSWPPKLIFRFAEMSLSWRLAIQLFSLLVERSDKALSDLTFLWLKRQSWSWSWSWSWGSKLINVGGKSLFCNIGSSFSFEIDRTGQERN